LLKKYDFKNRDQQGKEVLERKSFYFARHGESQHNKLQLCAGSQIDSPLTEKGIQQAHHLKTQIKNLQLDQVVSSPLIRAKKTAEIIWQGPLLVDEGLREFNFGVFEGTPDEGITEFLLDLPYDQAVPEGESKSGFTDRVINCFNKWLKTNASNLLFVAHGGIYFALLDAIGAPFVELDNAHLAHFQYDNGKWEVKC
jgi:broad specificity phosphatase PhoE